MSERYIVSWSSARNPVGNFKTWPTRELAWSDFLSRINHTAYMREMKRGPRAHVRAAGKAYAESVFYQEGER